MRRGESLVARQFADLTSAEKRAFCAEVSAEIRQVVSAMTDSIPNSNRELTLEYLDQNELGLALEHLCDTLIEKGVNVPSSEHTRISALFERMELESSGRLESLAPQEKD